MTRSGWCFCVNVDMVRIDEKDILLVRGNYYHCSYSWKKYGSYGIGPDAPISPKLIHHLSSLFQLLLVILDIHLII